MARINVYYESSGRTRYEVERNDRSFEGRKWFYTYEEAEIYRDYLQSIENQEKSLAQNNQIIENQKKLIKTQEQIAKRHTEPTITRQILDPEYREWLRFQKETDPNFKKWKEEEERKKNEILRKRREEEQLVQREKEKKSFEYGLASFRKLKPELKNRIDFFNEVFSLYNKLLKISFPASEAVSYETCYSDSFGDYEWDTFQIKGRSIFFEEDKNTLAKQLTIIQNNISELHNLDALENKLLALKDRFAIFDFNNLMKKIDESKHAFDFFYGKIYACSYDINHIYSGLKEGYYHSGGYSDSPYGFFAKRKRSKIINNYLKTNELKYIEVETIFNRLDVIMHNIGIFLKHERNCSTSYYCV